MDILNFLKGKKLKLLGLVWVVLAVVDGLLGYNILNAVDASNWVDNVMLGFGVFAGRDTLESLFDKLKAEGLK